MIKAPVVTALNTSTFVAILLPEVERTEGRFGRPMSFYTDDGSSFLWADNSSGTGAATIPADTTFNHLNVKDSDGIVMYAKASSGTPNLVTIIGELP